MNRLRRSLRGDITLFEIGQEVTRRAWLKLKKLVVSDTPPSTPPLLEDVPERHFFPGLNSLPEKKFRSLFPRETDQLLMAGHMILQDNEWPILGFGNQSFSELNWLTDPVSKVSWPLLPHDKVPLKCEANSDIRVLWELNRLSHLNTLAICYLLERDERYTKEFFSQLESWQQQNPYGMGPNWCSSMEVALRAINLITCFQIFRSSNEINEERQKSFFHLIHLHAVHIRENLEFSYLATSNHYLSNVTGLFWIGLMCPQLPDSSNLLNFGLSEMLKEMDKQINEDGSDYELSTGYHRLVLEMYLYSFILCKLNGIEIPEWYFKKLYLMVNFTRGYIRPDLRAPLIGDTDSGQIMPLIKRKAYDHAYLLSIASVLFNEPKFKIEEKTAAELMLIYGDEGVSKYRELNSSEHCESEAFSDAGLYIMRHKNLYLLFNASGTGLKGRGSHAHNDALSIELYAYGDLFIIDPGTYVYTADLFERQRFRSTFWHSTLSVDDKEQNRTELSLPFVIGDEAKPMVLEWSSGAESDKIVAEHYGYKRLENGVTHRREVCFYKGEDPYWIIEDTLESVGEHMVKAAFHIAPEMEVSGDDHEVRILSRRGNAIVIRTENGGELEIEEGFVSQDYGERTRSIILRWSKQISGNSSIKWEIIPVPING